MTTRRHCAFPGCPHTFVPRREDQQYCDAVCSGKAAKAKYRERKRAGPPSVWAKSAEMFESRRARLVAAEVWP